LQNGPEAGDTIVPLSHLAQNGNGAPQRRINKTVWMQTLLPLKLARERIDICHFTNSVATLLSPCPTVVTIHDMTLWLFPQHHYRRRLLAMRPFIPLAARRAAAVIAVSHATKADIVRILGVAADKVHVIHEAPAAWFRPIEDPTALETVRRRYGLPERIVLYVGTIEPRKNLVRLLQAFARLRHSGVIEHTLVLAGQPGWKHEPVTMAVEQLGLSQAVRFLGYVPTDDLVALYNLANALVFPSLYEGFGLPVMEAMACGTPVLTSANSSLAEISDCAAELVDPASVESIADGLRRILTDPARRADLRARGLSRAAQFTWTDAAQRTRAVYAEALALR
jgi:glycosyltransferase involved in cell wall biosynthesis